MVKLRYYYRMLLPVLVWMIPLVGAHQNERKETPSDVRKLEWMAGCWEISTETSVTVEHWSAPSSGTMLGVNRVFRNDKLWATEFMSIAGDSTGLTLTAKPQNQAEARFVATEASQNRAVFDNPDHDFPKRIVYENRGPDSLYAWISGELSFTGRRINFPFAHVTCED